MLPFFGIYEQICCQILNNFFYNVAIGRTQARMSLHHADYMSWAHGGKYNRKLIIGIKDKLFYRTDKTFEFQD